MFEYFKILMLKGLLASRKHYERITSIVEIMMLGKYFPIDRLFIVPAFYYIWTSQLDFTLVFFLYCGFKIIVLFIGSQLPCFRSGLSVIKSLKGRFHLDLTEEQLYVMIDHMVEQSKDSLTTRLYDNFQYLTNGIL